MILLCFGSLLFAGLLLVTGEAEGQIIVDDDNGTWADYGTIQEAIDAAGENATAGRDRILVYEGVYYENVDIDDTVVLKGNGSDAVRIEGSGATYAVDISSNNVTIEGINITGNGSGMSSHGIYCFNKDDLEVVDCTIMGSTNGIQFQNSDRLRINGTYIHNNSRNGVYMIQGYRARINDCVFENNSRYGFYIDQSQLANFTDTEFNHDSPQIEGSPSIRTTSHWFENTNVNGKPIYYLTNSSGVSVPTGYGQAIIAKCDDIKIDLLKIENADNAVSVLFSSNVSITNGSFNVLFKGVFLQNSDNCTISDCHLSGAASFGIDITWSTSTVVRNCIIRNASHGIQMYYRSKNTTIEGCNFTKNGIVAINVYYECDGCTIKDSHIMWGSGEGIYVYDSSRTNVQNVTINNTSNNGIYIEQESHYTNITNCTIRQVGAIGICLSNTISDCTITGSNIDDNSDRGVYAGNSVSGLTVTNNSIQNNSAQGIYFYGIDNSTIEYNNISGNGQDGIYITDCSDISISNSSITWNDIGISASGSYGLTVTYNEIFNNTDYGAYVYNAFSDGLFHHNNFMNNGESSSQAYDSTGGCYWNDTASEGNWWSDWGGSGNYSIDGSANAADEHPLGDPVATSAPEKVPEFIPLMAIGMVAVLFAVFRRRW